jgi:hypothetical protein
MTFYFENQMEFASRACTKVKIPLTITIQVSHLHESLDKVSAALSDILTINWLPQGSVPGRVLFLVCIELPKITNDCVLFVEDIPLLFEFLNNYNNPIENKFQTFLYLLIYNKNSHSQFTYV